MPNYFLEWKLWCFICLKKKINSKGNVILLQTLVEVMRKYLNPLYNSNYYWGLFWYCYLYQHLGVEHTWSYESFCNHNPSPSNLKGHIFSPCQFNCPSVDGICPICKLCYIVYYSCLIFGIVIHLDGLIDKQVLHVMLNLLVPILGKFLKLGLLTHFLGLYQVSLPAP